MTQLMSVVDQAGRQIDAYEVRGQNAPLYLIQRHNTSKAQLQPLCLCLVDEDMGEKYVTSVCSSTDQRYLAKLNERDVILGGY